MHSARLRAIIAGLLGLSLLAAAVHQSPGRRVAAGHSAAGASAPLTAPPSPPAPSSTALSSTALRPPAATPAPAPAPLPAPTAPPPPAPAPAASVKALAAGQATCSDLATWPLARRLAQLVMVGGQLSNAVAKRAEVAQGAGGVVFLGQPPAGSGPSIAAGMTQLMAAAGPVAPWLSTDEEGGGVARLSSVIGRVAWPRQQAARQTPAAVAATMQTRAVALRSLGINMDLAPVLDAASATNAVGSENLRSFSEDGNAAASYGLAFAQGLKAGGVVPVVKHFPGLGHVDGNTDTGPARVPPLSQLQTNDLIPFRRAAQAGIGVIMVSHAVVAGLTDGQPASLAPATYGLLRQQLGFGGVALTDDLSAGAISGSGYSGPAAAERAIAAGADMVTVDGRALGEIVQRLATAVDTGRLPLDRVDEAVRRVLAVKGVPACG